MVKKRRKKIVNKITFAVLGLLEERHLRCRLARVSIGLHMPSIRFILSSERVWLYTLKARISPAFHYALVVEYI